MHTGGTPAIVALERAGAQFAVHHFDHDPAERHYGSAAAAAIGVDPDRVFKTLLVNVEVANGVVETVVGIVPVSGQLSLRQMASCVGAKRAEMCPPALAERITGYVVGGISPFGQKKHLPTAIDETALLYDTIFVSGGKRGFDIEIAPADLIAVLHAVVAPIGTSR